MKTGLIITKIFTLIFLASCNAADQDQTKETDGDKFIITGRIENADGINSFQVFEGEVATHSVDLENNGEFEFEGNAPDATLYTLLVGQRPFMLIVKNGEEVEFTADLNDAITEKFREQQNGLQMEFEQRMEANEEPSAIQHDLMAKNQTYVSELSKQVLPFISENRENLAGFYAMLTLY